MKLTNTLGEFIQEAASLFTRAQEGAKKRFKVLDTGGGYQGSWAVNFGIAFAKNPAAFAEWRYEVYLSFWTRTLRIGFKRIAQPVVVASAGYAVSMACCSAPGEVIAVPERRDEFVADEANERP